MIGLAGFVPPSRAMSVFRHKVRFADIIDDKRADALHTFPKDMEKIRNYAQVGNTEFARQMTWN